MISVCLARALVASETLLVFLFGLGIALTIDIIAFVKRNGSFSIWLRRKLAKSAHVGISSQQHPLNNLDNFVSHFRIKEDVDERYNKTLFII